MDDEPNDFMGNNKTTSSSNLSISDDPSEYCKEFGEEPKIGMEFEDDDSAYKFYCSYAFKVGFSARKNLVKRCKTSGVVKWRTFCCSKEGKRTLDKRRKSSHDVHAVTRVGCDAQLSCSRQKNGKLKVVSFTKEHNHDLVKSPTKHMLRSHRKITPAQKALAEDAEKSGLSNKQTFDFMSRQAGGREYLGFMGMDYRNHIGDKRRMEMIKGDGGAVLEYFEKMKSNDPSFYYSIQLDDNDHITNIFWADSRSMVDYGHFGDVICFDTTYRTNEYGRPFAPIVGVNHHKQTVIFGGALLYDETEISFTWVFETFLIAMSGKPPKTILTDQCQAMANAIEKVFPETNHRLCVWHIYQNAAKHLSHVFHASKQFTKDFGACVYDYEEEDEWMCAWNTMLQNYDLSDDEWLISIYGLRRKWAMVYGRQMFTADMKSTQRSESMNSVLKKYLHSDYNLLQFFEHYNRLLVDRRYEELIAEFKMGQTNPPLIVNVEALRHAAEVYTPAVFKMFQCEYMKVLDCVIHKVSKTGTSSEYKVTFRKHEHKVNFDSETNTVQCSCMKFTFVGILCVHALKVLDKKNIKRLPSHYILTRWTKQARNSVIKDYRGEDIRGDSQESKGKRYSYLCQYSREVATIAIEDDDMYAHAYNGLAKLLKELQEMKRKCSDGGNSSLDDQSKSVHVVEHCDTSQVVRSIKRKNTVGRPRNSDNKRYKDPLEKEKKTNSKKSVKQKPSNSSGVQNKRRKKKTTNDIEELIMADANVKPNDELDEENILITQTPLWSNVNSDYVATNFGMGITDSTASTSWSQHQISFTQLLQESMTSHILYPSEEERPIE